MAIAMLSWMFAIPLLGVATGLRAMTPIAVLCWFAYLRYLPIRHSWAFWTANVISVGIFTVLALGEYVGDKLPRTPNRIAPGPLAARLLFGGLCGAIAATAMKGPGIEGVVLGVVGAALGSYGGYMVRRHFVRKIGCADWPVAAAEDIVALVLSILAMRIVTG